MSGKKQTIKLSSIQKDFIETIKRLKIENETDEKRASNRNVFFSQIWQSMASEYTLKQVKKAGNRMVKHDVIRINVNGNQLEVFIN